MPQFSYNIASLTLTEANGVVVNTINFEGTAEGFGNVVGTVTAQPVGEPSGTFSAVYASFPEEGPQYTATSSGEWHKDAWDQWSTTITTGSISNGQSFKGEGVFDLSARTWSGTFDV